MHVASAVPTELMHIQITVHALTDVQRLLYRDILSKWRLEWRLQEFAVCFLEAGIQIPYTVHKLLFKDGVHPSENRSLS